ncbi:hypothetical protein [Roseiflexus sp.]|uniref:hypothetical protein n=1 Tax=Roseiflexus sp. TaxID=2562120 RepID=UPI0025892982|nr:hypothetical protein [Roseiflexus sp.]
MPLSRFNDWQGDQRRKDKPLESYLQSIADLTQRGDARKESYYPVLKTLLEGIAKSQGCAIQVTVLSKKTEAGNPDFRVWDGSYQVSRRICCSSLNGFIRGLA